MAAPRMGVVTEAGLVKEIAQTSASAPKCIAKQKYRHYNSYKKKKVKGQKHEGCIKMIYEEKI